MGAWGRFSGMDRGWLPIIVSCGQREDVWCTLTHPHPQVCRAELVDSSYGSAMLSSDEIIDPNEHCGPRHIH